MHIVAECAACRARFKTPLQYSGARVRCPGCSTPVTLAHLTVTALPDGAVAAAAESPTAVSSKKASRRGKRRLLAALAAAALIAAAVIWPDPGFPKLNLRAEVSAAEESGAQKPKPAVPEVESIPVISRPELRDYAAEEFFLDAPPAAVAAVAAAAVAPAAQPAPSYATFDGWLQDIEAAKAKAAAEKKNILVFFHFDDELSGEMVEDVFFQEEFHKKTDGKFVLVLCDVVESREPRVKIENASRNRKLAERFHLESYGGPMTVLVDPQGQPYGFDVYIGGGHRRFFEDIAPYDDQLAERDEIFAEIAEAKDADKVAAIGRGFTFLQDCGLASHYDATLDQWLAFTRTADTEGKVAEELFAYHWMMKCAEFRVSSSALLNLFRYATVNQLLAELEQWKKDRPFKDHDREATLYMYAGGLLAAVGRNQDAVRWVEAGIALEPEDPELAVQLQRALFGVQNITGMGSGFVVSSDGHVLTNYHVVEGASRLMVQLPGRKEQVAAYVVAKDEKRDMALLKIRLPKEQLPAITVSAGNMNRGARVGAFGFPSSDITGSGLKLTTGIISATADYTLNKMLLLDCRVNPGNSGGPLCDTRGRVVGMVTAKSMSGGQLDSYGMALPGKDLDAFLQQHLPGYTATQDASDENRQEWEEIDQKVSQSVVMVIQKG